MRLAAPRIAPDNPRMALWAADRLVADVERLAVRGLPLSDFHRELGARLRRTFPIDAACWHGLDPRTGLLSTADPVELHEGGFLTHETEPLAARSVLASEYERDDFNTFATLARRRAPVGNLDQATRGRPERSARYREFLAPRGTPHELRGVFMTRGRAWGCVVLHRSEESGPFGESEARVLSRLSRPIAEGLRASVRLDAARRQGGPSAPGVIVLGPRDEVELVSGPAGPLLASLRRGSPSTRETLPLPVLTLTAIARRGAGRRDPSAAPSMAVPTDLGWVSLYASLPEGGRRGRVAIVIQRAPEEHALDLGLEASGLTDREREVAALVIQGLSTVEVAGRLFLSPWTVQDHLKSIFAKTGTRSRRELRAKYFFEEVMPAIVERRPLDAHGGLETARGLEESGRHAVRGVVHEGQRPTQRGHQGSHQASAAPS